MDNSKTREKNDSSTNSKENSNPKEDSNIDIINCSTSSDESEDIEEVLNQELATSSSSSFDDTDTLSDSEMSKPDNEEEDEAQRMLFNDYPLQNESENLGLRKKKMNEQYSEFTRAITWRSKWAEIKVKELNSQLREYKREIESYSQAKNWDLEKSKLQGYDGKSIPYDTYHNHKTKVYKRKRRKQVEKTVDIAAYTSNHNLFSYAETRIPPSCKARYPDTDHGTGCKTGKKEDRIEDEYVYPKFDSNDDELVARILCKIDMVKETIRSQKQRIDELIARESTNVEEIGKGNVSSDHIEDVEVDVEEIQEDVEVEVFGELYLNNDSPNIRDLLMDDSDVNYEDETVEDDEHLDYFRKLINSITGVPEEETEDEKEEDCAKRVSSKKRKK